MRKDGVKDGKGKMAREGTGAASDPIDIVVKEENIEIDKGDEDDGNDHDDDNLVHLLIKGKIRLKIAILKISFDKRPNSNNNCREEFFMCTDKSYLLQMFYFKCHYYPEKSVCRCDLKYHTFLKMSPCLHVSGLLMPFTGEESKSLEFLVDCYNQSKKTTKLK